MSRLMSRGVKEDIVTVGVLSLALSLWWLNELIISFY
jgi:hypothetical protein